MEYKGYGCTDPQGEADSNGHTQRHAISEVMDTVSRDKQPCKGLESAHVTARVLIVLHLCAREDRYHIKGGQDHIKGGKHHIKGGKHHIKGGQHHIKGGQYHIKGGQDHIKGGKHHIKGGKHHIKGGQYHIKGGQDHIKGIPK